MRREVDRGEIEAIGPIPAGPLRGRDRRSRISPTKTKGYRANLELERFSQELITARWDDINNRNWEGWREIFESQLRHSEVLN